MSTGTQKFEFGGPLRRDRKERPLPARSSTARKPDAERLRIVGIDDSTVLPESSSADEQASSCPPREPGVDLAMLHSHGIDTAKLAAFMNAAPAKRVGKATTSTASSGKAIEMPLPKTDLKQIFQTDDVCMVARPQGKAAAPSVVVEAKVEAKAEPAPVACVPVRDQKKPYFLDETQQYLVENWPKLPANVQAAILNVIDAAISPDDE